VVALELKVPADPASRLQVADRWFDLAERDSVICRLAIRRHAASWYRRVLRDLKETDRERVTKRLARLCEAGDSCGASRTRSPSARTR